MFKRLIKFIYSIITNKKVSVFIIGVQKGGTTALHNYLIQHPQIVGPLKKEVNFFNYENNYKAGNSWYHKQFPTRISRTFNKIIYLDSTPQYFDDLETPGRLYSYNKNSKIILLFRNPVDRAYSAWNMRKQFSELPPDEKEELCIRALSGSSPEHIEKFKNMVYSNPFPEFESLVVNGIDEYNKGKIDNFSIIQKGLYVYPLVSYLKIFPRNNILIIESNDLKKNKKKYLENILKFIGAQAVNIENIELKEHNLRNYDQPMNDEIRKVLFEFYRPHNEKLFEVLGETYNWDN